MAYGYSTYLRNKLIDWFHRGKAFTPPATVYMRLVGTTPTAQTAGTELSGTGYAPQAIDSTTAAWAATNGDGTTTDPSSGTSGTTSNNAAVDFGTAGSAWGTATHYEMWDASTGGNRLWYGEITDSAGNPLPRIISAGDPVKFPAATIRTAYA